MQPRSFNSGVTQLYVLAADHAVNIHKVEGYYATTVPEDAYLQLHQTTTTPATNAVPIWSRLMYQNAEFAFDLEGLGANPSCFVVSSNETKYVAPLNAGDTFNIFGTIEEYAGPGPIDYTDVAAQALDGGGTVATIFANATPEHKLISLTVVVPADHFWIQLFTAAAPIQGTLPWREFPADESATKVLNFGPDGLIVSEQMSANVRQIGLYVGVSTVPGQFVPDGNAGHTGTAAARYV